MDDAKLKLNCPALLAVPGQHADRLLESGDGDCALLYLHILKNGGALDVTRAAAELRRPAAGFRSPFSIWATV